MPAISQKELLRLRLIELFAPVVAQRKLHHAALTDVVARAMESPMFQLGSETGAALIAGDGAYSANEFLDSLDADPTAEHIMQRFGAEATDNKSTADSARLATMTSIQRLEKANSDIAARRAREPRGD